MAIDIIADVLAWCALINLAFLLIWFGIFSCAHDWMYRLHNGWFSLSVDRFDQVHYTAMAYFKLGIILLNLTPYLAIRIVL